jgi:hypothetical protein
MKLERSSLARGIANKNRLTRQYTKECFMVNPDNTTINPIPPEGGDATEEHPVAPVKPSDQSSKDFKKILGRNSREGKDANKKKSPATLFSDDYVAEAYTPEIFEKTEKDDTENASQGAFNVFDLSKQTEIKEPADKTKSASIAKAESPSDLFKRMSSPRVVQKEIAKKEAISSSLYAANKLTSRYNTEQVDLSYVNPLAAQPQISTESISSTADSTIQRPSTIDPNLPLLITEIEKLIKSMYTVEKQGQTDTVMTLDNPPLFKDAKIVVSAFGTAKGQFNISIENLTQQAQKILDMGMNKTSLLTALEQKGYNIHVFTTTTVQIENLAPPEQQSSHDREQQRQGGSPQHRNREWTG